MSRETQISAVISASTSDLLERYARSTGVKKGHIIEEALRHHLQALQELPADVIVPARLLVSRRSGKEVIRRLTSKPRPTAALRDLMSGDGH